MGKHERQIQADAQKAERNAPIPVGDDRARLDAALARPNRQPAARACRLCLFLSGIGADPEKFAMGEEAICTARQTPPRIWRMVELAFTAQAVSQKAALSAGEARPCNLVRAHEKAPSTALVDVDF